MKMCKSTTCFTKEGKPKTVFETEADALQCADYEKKIRNLDLIPYQCERCHLWHLAPVDSKVEVYHNACHCQDSYGRSKDLYKTYEDAMKVKQMREDAGSETLYIYECPEYEGYHLSHKKFTD